MKDKGNFQWFKGILFAIIILSVLSFLWLRKTQCKAHNSANSGSSALSSAAARLRNDQPGMMQKLEEAVSRGKWTEAVFWQEKLIEWSERDTDEILPNYYVRLANLLHMTAEYEREAEVMQKIVDNEIGFELNPQHISQLAGAYILLGEIKKARIVWGRSFLNAFEHYSFIRQKTNESNLVLVLPEVDELSLDEKERELVICLWHREIVSKTDKNRIDELKKKGYVDKTKLVSPLLRKVEDGRMLELSRLYGSMLKKYPQLLEEDKH